MKRTDMERMERELRRIQKREALDAKREDKVVEKVSVGTCARRLSDVLLWDEHAIYNANEDEDGVVEVLMDLKEALPEKQHEAVLKKAVKISGVKDVETSLASLRSLLEAC